MSSRPEPPADLRDKVVLITGASRGLGRAMALGLAAAGANLALTGRAGSGEQMAKVLESIRNLGAGGNAIALSCDVTDPIACQAIVDRTRERFGTVDVLINNAALGMSELGPHVSRRLTFRDVPLDTWRRIVETNVNGPFYMARAAVPLMLEQKWGRILNLTSGMATMVHWGFSPYGPSKAAVEAMTAIWAQDLAGTGITVNAMLPGWASDTDMIPNEDYPDRSILVPPSVMVAPAVWFASADSDGITGMRIVAKDWNPDLPSLEAFKAASAKAGW